MSHMDLTRELDNILYLCRACHPVLEITVTCRDYKILYPYAKPIVKLNSSSPYNGILYLRQICDIETFCNLSYSVSMNYLLLLDCDQVSE